MKLQQFSNGKVNWWGFGGDAAELKHLMNISGDGKDFDLLDPLCSMDMVDPFDPFLEVTADDPFYVYSVEMSPFISPSELAVAIALQLFDRVKMQIDWDQLNATPEALKFQITHKWHPCWGTQSIAEIGRFITKKNEVGIIKSLQTELTFEDNDTRWPRGDSAWFKRNLGVDVGEVSAKWALTIESLPTEDVDPNDFRVLAVTDPAQWLNRIPGTVHPEIEPWEEMLFLFGSDHEVHFRCPPSSIVSLWIYLDGPVLPVVDTGIFGYSGMMKGFTQVMGSDRTYENITRMY
jgi:hypothetical protein